MHATLLKTSAPLRTWRFWIGHVQCLWQLTKQSLCWLQISDTLLKRVEDLANECESGMTTLTNSSVMEETRRSAELSVVVWRYTAVAVVFVPLSFVCSFFGMNFAEMGQGELRLWIWFPSHGTRDFALFDYLLLGRVEKVIIKEGIEKCSLDIFPWSFRYSGKVFGSWADPMI